MKKIDRETVQRILDAADIVEVVSDFVSLKKRGANYIGLCPFHNERTPSFSVSKAKGICKCFSCGKGGSPVNFIMLHEQMTYNEALRYLAKKYHIEIKEREETPEEREQATERESMLAVNDFALQHFQHNLLEEQDGKDIGLAYFRERGINDLMIKKFKLGYALEKSDALLKAALAKGYSQKYLVMTGLCAESERGVYDRFRGRVIYPVFSISGRVVAYGGRTLRKDKNVAKYVNSPESVIYKKSYELYGLYQAKQAIQRTDKCILVEGYMDVISMHQVGVENVVASSGTSLTDGQIRLIHRFTNNVTIIYDSDPAGIKASLRGIDMLLSEGLNIKVLLLPNGEDPDSFAQTHSSIEVENYIKEHETDFIKFKTAILLNDAANDPIARARVITDIVKSISVIPDTVTRAVYLAECARSLNIDEKVLSLQMAKAIGEKVEKEQKNLVQEQNALKNQSEDNVMLSSDKLKIHEYAIAKYIVKYGLVSIAEKIEEGNSTSDLTVIEYVQSELEADEVILSHPIVNRIYNDALDILNGQWQTDKAEFIASEKAKMDASLKKGQDEIRQKAHDLGEIEKMETELKSIVSQKYDEAIDDYCCRYLEDMFLSSPDDEVRILATELASEKYQLSKVHTKYSHIETERERIGQLIERTVWELKFTILDLQITDLNKRMNAPGLSPSEIKEMMTQLFELYQLKSQFAKVLGDRIVNPR